MRPVGGIKLLDDGRAREETAMCGEKYDTPPPSLFRFITTVVPIHRVLPGHNYIGPGAGLSGDRGLPVDEDDKIAAQHTQAYQSARSWADVRRADREALDSLWRDVVSHRNWHSVLILLLLCVKYIIESVISRPLYPCSLPCAQEEDQGAEVDKTIGSTLPLQCSPEPPHVLLTSSVSVVAPPAPPSPGCPHAPPALPAVYLGSDEEVYQAIDQVRDELKVVRTHILSGALVDPVLLAKEIIVFHQYVAE
uniref:Uncharacterized protein n=1 Tax=Graphocephala atropunctata TaxID=36148 RepID=A0A1B6LS64_9HEMI